MGTAASVAGYFRYTGIQFCRSDPIIFPSLRPPLFVTKLPVQARILLPRLAPNPSESSPSRDFGRVAEKTRNIWNPDHLDENKRTGMYLYILVHTSKYTARPSLFKHCALVIVS